MTPESWDIFCKVIDNFGDAGVAARLARELAGSSKRIRIFIDDVKPISLIAPDLLSQNSPIEVIEWTKNAKVFENFVPADVVIECFACNIPINCINTLDDSKSVWINLEYLCAEDWIEGCHGMMSMEKGKKKWFFFPGFTTKTGGLNIEKRFISSDCVSEHSVTRAKNKILALFPKEYSSVNNTLVSVFSYENESLAEIVNSSKCHNESILFIIPEGRFSKFLQKKYAHRLTKYHDNSNTYITSKKNIVRFIPMTDQQGYDDIIAGCDFNVVRGEDSFVRTQIFAKPFAWHIYPQEEDYHLIKLDAFLKKMTEDWDPTAQKLLFEFSYMLNKNVVNGCAETFSEILVMKQAFDKYAAKHRESIIANGTLAENLMKFVITKL